MDLEDIVGKRKFEEGEVALDQPCELGFKCPFCKVSSEDLRWSEFRGFLWCAKCNKDIPSPICLDLGSPDEARRAMQMSTAILEMVVTQGDECPGCHTQMSRVDLCKKCGRRKSV